MADTSPKTIPVITKLGPGYASPEEFKRLLDSGEGQLANQEQADALHAQSLQNVTKEKVDQSGYITGLTALKGATDMLNPLSLVGLSAENLVYAGERAVNGADASEALQKNVQMGQAANPWAYAGGGLAGLVGPGLISKGLGALGGTSKAAGALARGGEVLEATAMAPFQGIKELGVPSVWSAATGALSSLRGAKTAEQIAQAGETLKVAAEAGGLAKMGKMAARFGTEMGAFSAGQEWNRQLGDVIAQRDGELDGSKIFAALGHGFLEGAVLGGGMGLAGAGLSKLSKSMKNTDEGLIRAIAGDKESKLLEIQEGAGVESTAGAYKEVAKKNFGSTSAANSAGPRAQFDAAEKFKNKVGGELETFFDKVPELGVQPMLEKLNADYQAMAEKSVGASAKPVFNKWLGDVAKHAGVVGESEAANFGELMTSGTLPKYMAPGVAKEAVAKVRNFEEEMLSLREAAASELRKEEAVRKAIFDKWSSGEIVPALGGKSSMEYKTLKNMRGDFVKTGVVPQVNGAEGFAQGLIGMEEAAAQAGEITKDARTMLQARQAEEPAFKAIRDELASIAKVAGRQDLEGAEELVKKLSESKMTAKDLWGIRKSVDTKAYLSDTPNAGKDFRRNLEDGILNHIEGSLGPEGRGQYEGIKTRYRGASSMTDILEGRLDSVRRPGEFDKTAGFGAAAITGGLAATVAGPQAGFFTSLITNSAVRQMSSVIRNKLPFLRADLAESMVAGDGVLGLLSRSEEEIQNSLSKAIFRTGRAGELVPKDGEKPKTAPAMSNAVFGKGLDAQKKNMSDFILKLDDPSAFVQDFASQLTAIGTHHPAAASSMLQTLGMGLAFLKSVAPSPKGKAGILAPIAVDNTDYSLVDLQRFSRYVEGVMRPASVFTHLEQGSLRQEHVDAVKNVHPKLYDYYLDEFRQMISDKKRAAKMNKIPVQTKMQLGKLFGIPWLKLSGSDMSMAIQASFSSVSADGQASSNPSRNGNPSGSNAKLVETETEIRNDGTP